MTEMGGTMISEIASDAHRRAVECYRLMKSANLERTNGNRDQAAYNRYKRKMEQLQDRAPRLFEEYLALFVE